MNKKKKSCITKALERKKKKASAQFANVETEAAFIAGKRCILSDIY